jgi:hypothetical protein
MIEISLALITIQKDLLTNTDRTFFDANLQISESELHINIVTLGTHSVFKKIERNNFKDYRIYFYNSTITEAICVIQNLSLISTRKIYRDKIRYIQYKLNYKEIMPMQVKIRL